MGRTRERAVYASDVVWVRMGSDVSRRRLPSGPRRVCRPFLAMDLPFSLCSRGSLESAQYWASMCAAPHDRACAGTAALPARTQFLQRCLPGGPPGQVSSGSAAVALGFPARARALSLFLALALALVLTLLALELACKYANTDKITARYMHANTCKQVSSCTSTHVYIIVKNVRITANRCAFTPACGYASARAHTQHSAQHHARTHSSRTHVRTHARTHVRTHARTHVRVVQTDGRLD